MAYINVTEETEGTEQELNSQEVIDQYSHQQPTSFVPTSFVPQSTANHTLGLNHNNPRVVVEAKESYIASEWNDYTIDPNAQRLADKGGRVLKGSTH